MTTGFILETGKYKNPVDLYHLNFQGLSHKIGLQKIILIFKQTSHTQPCTQRNVSGGKIYFKTLKLHQ